MATTPTQEPQLIDLRPENLGALRSLITTRQKELQRKGHTPSRAWVIATDEVAQIVRPFTTGMELDRWMGTETAKLRTPLAKPIVTVPLPENSGKAVLLTADQAQAFFHEASTRNSRLDDLIECLGGMQPGQTKLLPPIASKIEARRTQASVMRAAKHLRWGKRRTRVVERDGHFLLAVKRIA